MSANRQHHFVPQFLLRRFSPDGRSIAQFILRSQQTIERSSIRGQCQRPHFYRALPGAESSIADIEAQAAQILLLVEQNRAMPPPRSLDHILLMLFVILQRARTTAAEASHNEMTDTFAKHLLRKSMAQDSVDIDKVTISKQNAVLETMAHHAQLFPLTLDLRGVVLVNNTSTGFVICDNPVVFYNQFLEERTYASNTGLQSVGLQVFIPISANASLMFFDGAVYGIGRRQPKLIELANERDVIQLNSLQILNASESVYFDTRRNALSNVAETCSRLIPKRPMKRANLHVQKEPFQGPNEQRELVGMYFEDIRINLTLSFVTVFKNAKRMRAEIMKRFAVRDPLLVEEFHKFGELVKAGRYGPGRFMEYMHERAREEIARIENQNVVGRA